MSNEQIERIQRVYRTRLTKGFRFTDQDGNVLRKKATRPYTHMAVQQAGLNLFLSFHSTANPSASHSSYTIKRVVPIIADPTPTNDYAGELKMFLKYR